MKNFILFLSLFFAQIKAGEIYYDDSNEFFTAKESKEFIAKYFHKPLDMLRESIIDIEIISIERVENVQEICKVFEMRYDKEEDACFDDLGAKFCDLKTKDEMKQHILKSIEIPTNFHNSNYMFIEDNICGYTGEVRVFGYIWNFKSRGGSIELTRKTDKKEKIFSINENPVQAYRQGKIEDNEAKKYLVCMGVSCKPRAEQINH
ncbi:hypothetical protein [Helicobacter sp. MIT 05-5294]|uniref:hypothetical protein n=1 Tax=Helicobacter sp. MIT 05-5294 TaxID=1548150 RepID=UPI00051FCE59|nr:hypothetical protein [Helicobacter sp. MIT 05-5294]TLD84801.1 hypothetical protein LS69_009845 [Helicobacter sp. MIT 05-5294]